MDHAAIPDPVPTRLREGFERIALVLRADHWASAARAGLNPIQAQVLALLGNRPAGLRAKEIAAFLAVSPPSMADTLAALERKGLVARTPDPSDARAAIARPTRDGRALAGAASTVTDALTRLSPAEQAEKLHRLFAPGGQVAVLGLHTVFEHHAAMTEAALEAFIHDYRLTLPVGVDRPGHKHPIPQTMRRYGTRGTPTTVVIDRGGTIRRHAFGQVDDLALGALVGSLASAPFVEGAGDGTAPVACDDGGCPLPTEPPR